MNNIKQLGILLMSGMILSACGMMGEEGAPEDLVENWPQYIQEGTETLESYASETEIDLSMVMGPDLMTDEDEVFITMEVIGDLEKGHMVEDDYEMYFDGNDVYVLEGGNWDYYPDGGPIEYASWYPNVVNSLTEIEDLIEVTHTDGTLELTYEGNDREVWDAFEEEFSLSIDGVSEENIRMNLEATVDESFYYLEDLTLDIVGVETQDDVEVANITILIEIDYSDHNEVELTEIEEEIEAAEEN